jgi:hypothetical protein
MSLRTLIIGLAGLGSLAGCTVPDLAPFYCGALVGGPLVVDISTNIEPPVVHNDRTRNQISTQLSQAGKPVLAGQGLGSTTAAYAQSTEISLHTTVPGPGFVCARPKITVALVVRGPRIDIAREFEPGSCRYASVLHHEQKHVAAYTQHLLTSRDRLDKLIRSRYEMPGYYLYPTEQALDHHVTAEVRDWLVPTISAQLSLNQVLQQTIDSSDEYARLTRECPAEPL